MLGSILSIGFGTVNLKKFLFGTCLRKFLPMDLFANMHIGRLPFQNQIKVTYILVNLCHMRLNLEKHTPQTHGIEWRQKHTECCDVDAQMCVGQTRLI